MKEAENTVKPTISIKNVYITFILSKYADHIEK